MASYIGRRLLLLTPTLFGVSLVSFFLIHLAPGDPATAILGVLATPVMIARFRAQYHLDQPVPIQYLRWLGGVLTGDLGYSVVSPIPVSRLLADHLTPTVLLTSLTMTIVTVTGVVTGVASALRRGRLVDSISRATWLVGLSMPSFWLGLLLIMLVGVYLRWLPTGGYVDPWVDPVACIQTLILPSVTMAIPLAAIVSRITRVAVLDVVQRNYIRTARAKGMPERIVIWRHVLWNAATPAVTTLGLQIGYLLGGAVVIENVFSIPGLGRLLVFSVINRDYAVVQGIVLVSALAVIMAQLVVDLFVATLDRRVVLK